MIKGFDEWINENEEDRTRSTKRIDPTGWVASLVQDLESRHATEPDTWGKPVLRPTPYNTLEFTISSDMVNMPEQHYNNYEYTWLYAEPVTVVIYLGGDSHLELRASYANPDFEEEYGREEDQYDATWAYDGLLPILTIEGILEIIDEFNNEVDSNTIEDSPDWRHD